jgi:FkbM family methyltransferase
MLSERSIAFSRAYKVVGDDNDTYFSMLPNHDLSALYNFLSRNRGVVKLDRALDVGANLGLSSLCMIDLFPDVQIAAFEPSRETFAFLTQNIEINGLTQRVRLEELAVGDQEGELGFDYVPNFAAGSKISADGTGSYKVKVVTLDGYLKGAGDRVDFIKIDVEGHEIATLKGARQTLANDKPIVFFECNPSAIVSTGEKVEDFLAQAGDLLGPLGRVVPISGEVFELPADGVEANAALRAQMATDFEVFDLVTLRPGLDVRGL